MKKLFTLLLIVILLQSCSIGYPINNYYRAMNYQNRYDMRYQHYPRTYQHYHFRHRYYGYIH